MMGLVSGKSGVGHASLKFWSALLLVVYCSSLVQVSVAYYPDPYTTRQQLELHESLGGNETAFIFQRQVPDATKYDFSRIKLMIVRGHWTFFSEINYTGYAYDAIGWWDYYRTKFPYKSFRYDGANDFTQDAFSLFPEENWTGQEILVTQFAFGGIQSRIQSFGYTGNSTWTVFEGANFDGKSICLPAPSNFLTFGFESIGNVESELKITTIGSLFKGCPPKTRMYDAYIESVREFVASTSTK